MTRLLIYCHNVTGLGHIMRASLVAAHARGEDRAVTLLTGCPHLSSLALPPHVAVETLPPARLCGLGFAAHDGDPSVDIIRVRQQRIIEILRRIAPHAVLVDHHPFGLGGELVPALNTAHAEGWSTRFIWGIPYLAGGPIGSPRPANPRLRLAAAQYSSAIGYCDPTEWQDISRQDTWAVPARREYVGLVADPPAPPLPVEPGLVTVLCGGGSSARALVELVLDAHSHLATGAPRRLRIITGPMADAASLAELVARHSDVEWHATGASADMVRDADVVIARCGYNTAALLLQIDRPVIFIPTVGASGDQLVRAERLAAQPGVWSLPTTCSADDLSRALAAALGGGPVARDHAWLQHGAQRAADWLAAEGRDAAGAA